MFWRVLLSSCSNCGVLLSWVFWPGGSVEAGETSRAGNFETSNPLTECQKSTQRGTWVSVVLPSYFGTVGHYKFHQADIDNTRPQVAKLKSLFPHLIINHNPYSMCPNTRRPNIPQSDPSFRFRRNIGPNSWTSRRDAEVVPIFDLN